MGVKLLAEKRGSLQGLDVSTIVRQAYGEDYKYDPTIASDEHVGAVVHKGSGAIVDHVVEFHDV